MTAKKKNIVKAKNWKKKKEKLASIGFRSAVASRKFQSANYWREKREKNAKNKKNNCVVGNGVETTLKDIR